MRILGIDPGKTGAIALVTENYIIDVKDIPIKKKKNKTTVDFVCLSEYLLRQRVVGVQICGIEIVASHPSDGGVSAFSFGYTCGGIRGVLDAIGFDIVELSPQFWKKQFDLIGAKKEESIDAAKARAQEVLGL